MTIIHLERSQTNQASALLADVFNKDPMFRFLVSEAQVPIEVIKLLCKFNLRKKNQGYWLPLPGSPLPIC